MNKKILILLPLVALVTACDGASSIGGDEAPLTFISPAGAPALAFYDQGSNANYITNSTATNVAAELQNNNYDIVIFDSISGLTSIKRNNLDFKLAQIITGGNFYLAGIDVADGAMPDENSYVVSFGENLIPDLVWQTLCNEYWHIDIETHYVGSNSDAQAVLASGLHNGNSVDYVFIAQPALYATMNNASAATYGKVSIIKNIREEWKQYSNQDGIPQAGVFVRSSVLESKPNNLKTFFSDLNTRLITAINDPQAVKDAMNVYSEDLVEQVNRFGFNANVMYNVQKDNANGFGMVAPSEVISVNDFIESLNNEAYTVFDDSYFVTIE